MIGTIKKISASTTAQDVSIDYQEFYIQNLSEDKTVYFKEKDVDGAKCNANNGFALAPGKTFEKCLQAKTLSVYASGSADVRIMFME